MKRPGCSAKESLRWRRPVTRVCPFDRCPVPLTPMPVQRVKSLQTRSPSVPRAVALTVKPSGLLRRCLVRRRRMIRLWVALRSDTTRRLVEHATLRLRITLRLASLRHIRPLLHLCLRLRKGTWLAEEGSLPPSSAIQTASLPAQRLIGGRNTRQSLQALPLMPKRSRSWPRVSICGTQERPQWPASHQIAQWASQRSGFSVLGKCSRRWAVRPWRKQEQHQAPICGVRQSSIARA